LVGGEGVEAFAELVAEGFEAFVAAGEEFEAGHAVGGVVV